MFLRKLEDISKKNVWKDNMAPNDGYNSAIQSSES